MPLDFQAAHSPGRQLEIDSLPSPLFFELAALPGLACGFHSKFVLTWLEHYSIGTNEFKEP